MSPGGPRRGCGLIIQRQENASLQGGFALRAGPVWTWCAVVGHVLLAFEATDVREAIIEQLPRPLGWPLAKLQRRLAVVRKRGYEMQASARTAGVTDVGHPIFGFDGRVAAALTVPYLTVLDDPAAMTLDQTRALLQKAARMLSAGLGFTAYSPGTSLAV